MQTIIEYIKLLGMTVVFTVGQVIGFYIVVPLWSVYNEVKDEKTGEEN